MSFSAADDLKERVRAETDIVSVLGSYLQLQRQGRIFVARCPWHDDERPSLQVNPDRQSWKCWPCNDGGDVFSFVMKRENLDFPGALRMLADRAGIEFRTANAPKAKPGSAQDKTTLYKAMAWAEQRFQKYLLQAEEAKPARGYLDERGINQESISRYHIGFAPKEWSWLLDEAKSAGYSSEVLEAVGLAIRNEKGRVYDRFRGRVMFPIRDLQQRAIAVGGRILPDLADDKSAKYINSPETRLYSKSEQLYGLDVVRDAVTKSRHLMVMEGYTDVVVARQEGIDNVIAVCGTALGAGHLKLLRRFADRVTLILDGDAAGQRRAAEVLELFVAGQVELRLVTLPDGLDPCDFVLSHGAQALQQLVEQASDALDFHVEHVTRGIDLASDTHRANAALQKILQTMSRAPRLQHDTPAAFRLREQQTLSRLSRMFRVDEPLLREQISELRSRTSVRPPQSTDVPATPHPQTLDGWEREVFTLLIQNPDAIAAIIENVGQDDMQTPAAKSLLALYQQVEADGQIANFEQIMLASEDAMQKHMLAELADEADRITTDDAELLLNDILTAFHGRRQGRQRAAHIAELQSGKLAEEEELEVLNRLIESKRQET